MSATGLAGSIGSVSVDSVAADGARLPGLLVHVEDDRVQLRAVLGSLHAHRQAGEETLQNGVRIDADHRAVGPGHAAIGLVGRAAGQDTGIGATAYQTD